MLGLGPCTLCLLLFVVRHGYIIPTAFVFRLSSNPVLCLQLGIFVYMKFVMFSLNLM